jgi:hypothetical protein
LQAIKKLSDELGPEQLVVVEYHTKDTWSFRETEALYKLYDPEGTPTIYFDGANGVSGGSDTDYLYARYKRIVTKEAVVVPVVRMNAAKLQENSPGAVIVELANTSGSTIEGAWLYGVAYQDLGTERHHFMASAISKKYIPRVAGDEILKLELLFDTQASLLNIVVFLKSNSGQIIQAVLIPGSPQLWLP